MTALLAFVFSLGLNYAMLRLLGSLGKNKSQGPEHFRWNQSVRPLTGGIAMAVPLLWFCFSGDIPDAGRIGIFLGIALLAGLLDDLFSFSPFPKLGAQFVCGLAAWWAGLGWEFSGMIVLDVALTCLLLSGLLNSLNMLDNMDGVAGFAVLGCLLPWAVGGQDWLWVVIACVSGFLVFNFYPSRVFMGDSGSHFLGAVLFWFCQDFTTHSEMTVWWGQGILLYGLLFFPITDSLVVTLSRLIRKQSPLIGGRDHLTHLLVRGGLSQAGVPILLLVINASLGFWVNRFHPHWLGFLFVVFGIQLLLGWVYYRVWTGTQWANKK